MSAIPAVNLLYKLIELNTYNEDVYHLLIKALVKSGQLPVAKRIYADYEQTVKNELGVLPAARIRELIP